MLGGTVVSMHSYLFMYRSGSFTMGAVRVDASVRSDDKDEGAWVFHKQNKFQVHCSLKGSLLSVIQGIVI